MGENNKEGRNQVFIGFLEKEETDNETISRFVKFKIMVVDNDIQEVYLRRYEL